jgi:predicted methyltransferase
MMPDTYVREIKAKASPGAIMTATELFMRLDADHAGVTFKYFETSQADGKLLLKSKRTLVLQPEDPPAIVALDPWIKPSKLHWQALALFALSTGHGLQDWFAKPGLCEPSHRVQVCSIEFVLQTFGGSSETTALLSVTCGIVQTIRGS